MQILSGSAFTLITTMRKFIDNASTQYNNTSEFVVITPVKNEELFIKQTIDSVINQTFKPKTWIIVDDGQNSQHTFNHQ